MAYEGDIRLGDTIDMKFTTVQSTGAPITLAGTPVISAYPANSTTQLTAGITLSVDFDGVTGLHNVRVVATGGNGYLTATNYTLVITTGTINGVSAVGYVVGSFSIENRSALMPTTVARTLVVDAAGLADANVVKVGPTASGTAQTARDIGAAVPAAVPGAAGGLFIAGTNAPVTITGSGDALTLSSTAANGRGLRATGNGSGAGVSALGGATGNGIEGTGGATSGDGMRVAGGTSGHGLSVAGAGSGRHGLLATSATAGVSDGVSAVVAGGTGVPIRGDITGNLVGTATTVTNLTNAPTAGDFTATMKTSIGTAVAASAVASVTGAVGSVTGAVGSVTGAVGSVTGAVGSVTGAVGSVTAFSAAAIDSLLDDTIGDGTITMRQALRILIAGMGGKLSGAATTTVTIRNLADSANVIVATVDSDGNRSAVTVTP